MVDQVTDRLHRLIGSANDKAVNDITTHGLRDPWVVLQESLDLSTTLMAQLSKNPDCSTVEEYAASLGALALQIALAAPIVFTSQPSIFTEPDRQIELDMEAA